MVTNKAGAGWPGQTPARCFQLQTGQGRAARADTRSLFSVTDRAGQGQGQGRAARVDTRTLFLVTLAFLGRYLLATPHELFPAMAYILKQTWWCLFVWTKIGQCLEDSSNHCSFPMELVTNRARWPGQPLWGAMRGAIFIKEILGENRGTCI